MASIHREIFIEACPDEVWDALRDVGAIHTRLAPGFVTDVQLEGGDRIVTFGNGRQARERMVSVDDAARRVVWSVVGGAMTHHNASAQVFPHGSGCRFVWIADLLPDALEPLIAGMIEQGLAVIGRHLGRRAELNPAAPQGGRPKSADARKRRRRAQRAAGARRWAPAKTGAASLRPECPSASD